MNLEKKIKALEGPILIIGSSGFIGANLLRKCLQYRDDVTGTFRSSNSWRLDGISSKHLSFLNLQAPESISATFNQFRPNTIFDCSAFGSYSFEQEYNRIHDVNYQSFITLMEEVAKHKLTAFIHAGSSSEYGKNAGAPKESDSLIPNSHYAVSKAATSQAITYYGKVRNIPVVNLRLYSVYGPYEDSSRLVPVLCMKAIRGSLPTFAGEEVARDFIHVDDVIEAFADAAIHMSPKLAGESFNIGTGIKTSLSNLAHLAREVFAIQEEPRFSLDFGRSWDEDNWYANPEKAASMLEWSAKVSLRDGLLSTRDWWHEFLVDADFSNLTKKQLMLQEKNSISAIVACYKDELAIPVMYDRLVKVFERLGLEYEIIFVNDCSPDNSAEVIRKITASNPNVIGISHSRNFGSQAAFRSGMEIAKKKACVLLDGDLQDPPELIEQFVSSWRAGADIVYGRRIKREMPILLEVCYRTFYRLFAAMSEIPVPKNAGDFSLIDRVAVHWILQCQERDSFLRGLRAFVGFKQTGVDYVRPERMFGVSTNNWIKNIGWAKKAIFSFSRVPLHLLTAAGGIACIGTILVAAISILIRFSSPDSVPKGITFLSLLVMFFGSFLILGIGLLGEYIGKIFEETKARPPFIRSDIIANGKIKTAHQEDIYFKF